jgi:hypothetical protein
LIALAWYDHCLASQLHLFSLSWLLREFSAESGGSGVQSSY